MTTKTILKTASVVALALGLAACGGGGGGGNSSGKQSVEVDDSFIISNLKKGNQSGFGGSYGSFYEPWADGTEIPMLCGTGGYCHEDLNQPAVENALHRYRVFANSPESELIPVYFHGFDNDNRIVEAMKEIETTIGFKVFKNPLRVDIEGIDEYPFLSELYENGEYQKKLLSKGGLIFTLGKTDNFGHVSTLPHLTDIPGHTIDADGYFTFNDAVWVNLDNYEKGNIASVEVTAHEIAHAMGMLKHFPSFGDGAPFGNGARAVLKTLYNNDAGLDFDNLTVYK